MFELLSMTLNREIIINNNNNNASKQDLNESKINIPFTSYNEIILKFVSTLYPACPERTKIVKDLVNQIGHFLIIC